MTAPATAGPLRQVLAALQSGAGSLDQVARSTGLPRSSVDAAVDHLVRMGRVDARELATGCPDGGCGSCASGTADGASGCGSDGPSRGRSGPVLVQLSVRRPR
ncbi:FeoC-like transcriptional regulator [Arsenicicoccus dermatophilus]|uniref:FeoC-like transcriptional regulator n=1 Tax=Arsenicicoccus dermatophilus TaxID=1076331 RepID=UPI001F4CF7C9|nr:FeoC-like transcriptional regulator [Arsenicicoccus dermatophilus]MCH8612163.1 FeoC-like transcriptional regulator [Arsenicicoccus dermatophilus]